MAVADQSPAIIVSVVLITNSMPPHTPRDYLRSRENTLEPMNPLRFEALLSACFERFSTTGMLRSQQSTVLRQAARTRLVTRTLRTSSIARNSGDDYFIPAQVERAEDEVDVCIVGGGPAGLSAAIRLKQLERERGNEIRVVVLEKGSEVGK